MNLLKPGVKKLIERKDYTALQALLSNHPNLANKGITIPFDYLCTAKAHPLHRLCDGVMAGKITDDDAVNLATILLENGANIDGDKNKNEGTPLLAAASLHAEQVGMLYIDHGADIHHTYKNDGASALHWAAFCGRDKLVARLIKANAEIDQPDKEYNSTPLGWAIHALKTNDIGNKHNQLNCIKLLLQSNADSKKLDKMKEDYLLGLAQGDAELQNLLA